MEVIDEELSLLEPVQKWWVNEEGVYMISTVGGESEIDASWIEVPFGPDYWDQVWDFEIEAYGPSTFSATQTEDAWRDAELATIAEQLLMLEDEDPNALPGTAAQWRAYRIQVRAWKTGNADFPFGARPTPPAESAPTT
ncbi:hypothetical protein PSGK_18810 [Pseudomonas solani]|uniref:hypothetical protein n=1 Tax=Pseudomonas solani TaxID=2731552 RepID=UPI0035BE22E5